MADLKGVIRLSKHELDEKRRVLGDLNDALARLEQHKQILLDQLEEEKQAVAEDETGVYFTMGAYVTAVKARREELENHMRVLDQKIAHATDEVRDAFAELKKYEQAQERRDKAEQAERDAKETAELDEIGLETYRRRDDG